MASLRPGDGWTDSKMLVLFQLVMKKTSAILSIYLSPGDKAARDALFENLKQRQKLPLVCPLKIVWRQLFQKQLFKFDIASGDINGTRGELERSIEAFLTSEFKKMEEWVSEAATSM
jgi:hypothetical protein